MPSRRSPTKTDPFDPQIEAALQPGHFMDYGTVWSFVEEVERVEDAIAKLVASAPARAVVLYETFVRCLLVVMYPLDAADLTHL